MSQVMAAAVRGAGDISVDEWVVRARSGDDVAFTWMVETFSQQMAQVCFVVCGDADLADGAVAAAWPIIWRKLDTLRDSARLRPWLMSVAANQARQLARSRRRRALREIPVSSAGDPSAGVRRVEEIDLANALSRLKPDDRALLALRYVAGFDSIELASATGLSPSGTRARLARLLSRMRAELADV
jgi:RNA polymerase sigma-70 factor (ECF subfamily)